MSPERETLLIVAIALEEEETQRPSKSSESTVTEVSLAVCIKQGSSVKRENKFHSPVKVKNSSREVQRKKGKK